ncbi:thiamine repressible regulatory thi1 [Fusarium mexicanum]|uniref:Thiamine repressible regulatory thi1 n=1 Tax=Fusarium mexicanum TaxID=751941 RepID=A0A8H5MJ72_9HYPO|nr:thiamine repressible regulatory thi1 [Fusarium mexicanum]
MAPSSLKRVSKACDRCRRRKERCDGTAPCARCQKHGRECSFLYAGKPLGRPRKTRHDEELAIADFEDPLDTDSDFFDVDRIQALECIVRYYTGLDHLNSAGLQDVIMGLHTTQNLSSQAQGQSQNVSAAQLEHWPADSPGAQIKASIPKKTSNTPPQTANDQHIQLQGDGALDSSSSQLLSHDVTVVEAASVFPTPETASTLISIFFEFGQMNYFFLDESTFRSSLDQFHNLPSTLTAKDAPWVCTVLMVFTIGVQFSHLKNGDKIQADRIWMDDALALMYFRQASRLVPNVLAIASLQSAQALLLMGFYILPLGHYNLASTYFSIGLKMVTEDCLGLEREASFTVREVEVRRRVWCTAFILERRNSVYHGNPVGIIRPPLGNFDMLGIVDMSVKHIDTHQNTKAMVNLTNMLEHVWHTMSGVLDLEARQLTAKLRQILDVRDELLMYWENLPDIVFGRDLCPHNPLFRHNAYLALSYHSIHIFIGRPFILEKGPEEMISEKSLTKMKNGLIASCVESALATIDLCQKIKDQCGLSRSSYIEFTSCHAAVSALVAASISSQTSRWSIHCRQGLTLLRAMLGGVFSQRGGREDVERLEYMVDQLLGYECFEFQEELHGGSYGNFLEWGAALLQFET